MACSARQVPRPLERAVEAGAAGWHALLRIQRARRPVRPGRGRQRRGRPPDGLLSQAKGGGHALESFHGLFPAPTARRIGRMKLPKCQPCQFPIRCPCPPPGKRSFTGECLPPGSENPRRRRVSRRHDPVSECCQSRSRQRQPCGLNRTGTLANPRKPIPISRL